MSFRSPFIGQIIGFVFLTLPVFFYFVLNEKSKHKATIGKKINKIYVASVEQNKATGKQVFMRNFFKLLPWEIAHTGVHWIVFYSNNKAETPVWVFILLIVPQIIVLIYVISVFTTKGATSIYDKIAGTGIRLLLI